MPRLQLLAGPSPDSLKPIRANKPSHAGAGTKIKSARFEGEISVFIKDFVDEDGKRSTCEEYFASRGDRKDEERTWSIQAKGRYLKEGLTAADVLFGNIFDRALPLPTGTSVAMKFLQHKDPTLEHDLYAPRPWLLSPLFATVQYLSYTETAVPAKEELPPFNSSVLINENTSKLVPSSTSHSRPTTPDAPSIARRTHFATPDACTKVPLGPSKLVEADFCHGYLSFGGEDGSGNLSLTLPVMSFDLMKYWDGRPIWYVCCEKGKDGKGPGEMFWCVGFQILDGEDDGKGEKAEALPDNSEDID